MEEINGPIITTVQDIPFLEKNVIEFAGNRPDNKKFTFVKGIKVTIKPKKNGKEDGKIEVASEVSRIKISKRGNVNLLVPIERRPDKKTSKKRSFGQGTCVILKKET